MKINRILLASLVLVGCAPEGTDQTGRQPVQPAPTTSQFSTSAQEASSPLVLTYPPAWDTAFEVPLVVEAPTPEEEAAVVEVLDEVVDLSVPIELGDSILFSSGTAIITDQADAVLDALARAAVAQLLDGQLLEVHGYVDEVGTPEFNEWLGNERALAVVDRLVRHEPSLEGRVIAIGHGEDELLEPSCRGDCASNRKVIVQVAE